MPTLAHKIEIQSPNKATALALAKAAGTARFSYNWALATWNKKYEAHKKDPGQLQKPTIKSVKQEWSQVKHTEFPWLKESPANANLQPLDDLGDAFKRFFKGTAKHPKFKKKGKSKDSFYVDNQKLKVFGKTATLPKIGKVRLTEPLRFKGRILSGTVSREGNRWFLAINVELPEDFTRENERVSSNVAGVDLGLKSFAVIRSGTPDDLIGVTETIENPRFLKRSLVKLKHVQQAHSRKMRGSENRKKAALKVNSIHRRVRNQRQDFQHKLTTRLCRENQVVVIETLNVAGLVKNRKLSRAISDAGWGEFGRQMMYKGPLFGTTLIKADRFYASSKLCSVCGWKCKTLNLSHRYWLCACGACHDRDENASINLRTLGMREDTVESLEKGDLEVIYACGGLVRPSERLEGGDPLKQEAGDVLSRLTA